MSTTTLKLPAELKERIAVLAGDVGKSAHAYMLDALESEARRAELRKAFVTNALAAEQEVARDGKVYAMDAVHRHFRDKLAGVVEAPPKSMY